MRISTWLVMAALVATGCGDDDASTPPPKRNQARATVALAESIHFDGAEVQSGKLALATESRVSLLLTSEQQVSPNQTGIMAFDVDNPIEDESPTNAVLLQFGDSDEHMRVPATPDDDGHIALDFEIDSDVCKDLCNTRIDVPLTAALELGDRGVSKHLKTKLVVDCREEGDPDACDDTSGPMNGGADGGTSKPERDASTPADTGAMGAAQNLIGSIGDFSASLCACLPDGTPCMADPSSRECEDDALLDNAAGAADFLECARTFYEEQTACIEDAKCDPEALVACTMTADGADPWASIEASCGAPPASLSAAFSTCEASFTCGDGDQISTAKRCDGVEDCNDGSDETGCDAGGLTSFPCTDGTMVDIEKLCDGTNDCSTGIDEMICAECPDGSGKFSSFQICDGKNACDDGSDESGCMYPCNNGEMIKIQKFCDGTPDCSDGSDESLCSGTEFKCSDGSSIPIMKLCDGTRDCSDGGDEASRMCG